MKHRVFNWLLALAILAVMAAIQTLDAQDFETELEAERRDWMYAQQHCLRMYGAQAQPEYDHYGVLICRTRRGEALAYRGHQK
jgi:hypothetical protein